MPPCYCSTNRGRTCQPTILYLYRSYKVFPMRQQMYHVQHKLRWEEALTAIQYLIDIIRNEQIKQCETVTTLAQLHLDYTGERQGLTLYLDQQLKWQGKPFQDQQEKNTKKIADETTKLMCSSDEWKSVILCSITLCVPLFPIYLTSRVLYTYTLNRNITA